MPEFTVEFDSIGAHVRYLPKRRKYGTMRTYKRWSIDRARALDPPEFGLHILAGIARCYYDWEEMYGRRRKANGPQRAPSV